MSINAIAIVCHRLNLGTLINIPQKVTGGLLHKIWHVITSKGEYAIKELNPVIMAKTNIIESYELSEKVARLFFDVGIPAVPSLQHDKRSLIEVDGKFFIVYPWVNGVMLSKNAVSIDHAEKIGSVFAKIHNANLRLLGVKAEWSNHTDAYYQDIISRAIQSKLPYSEELEKIKNYVLICNQKYHTSISILKNDMIVSHCDLDQKNVLWQDNLKPMIIDWEGSQFVNPTQEIINAALDWSGIATGTIDEIVFQAIINSYKKLGGQIDYAVLEAALNVIVINWLNWAVYNIERSLNKDLTIEERQLAIEQLQTVKIIAFIFNNSERLIGKIKTIESYGKIN